jgi:hypothetical protein
MKMMQGRRIIALKFNFLKPEIILITLKNSVAFEHLTEVIMKNSMLLDITPYSPLKVSLRFGVMFRLNLQRRRINQARN